MVQSGVYSLIDEYIYMVIKQCLNVGKYVDMSVRSSICLTVCLSVGINLTYVHFSLSNSTLFFGLMKTLDFKCQNIVCRNKFCNTCRTCRSRLLLAPPSPSPTSLISGNFSGPPIFIYSYTNLRDFRDLLINVGQV